MSTSVDLSFVKQYEAEVHEAYQRQGSKLRNTVRVKNGIVGADTTFQKVGKGVAGQKTRHGKVPVMNIDHTPVNCPLNDWYAGDWHDKLDDFKTKNDERNLLVRAGAFALGRKTDQMIVEDALASATQQIAAGGAGMTLAKALEAVEILGNNDVNMEDGDITAVVGWNQWTDLMQISEFSDADYVGDGELPFEGKGLFAKRWMGALWMPHSGLTKTGDNRLTYVYHKTAIGHAIGADTTSDVTWHGDYASWFINNMMSQGSCLIDTLGVVEILCDET